MSRLFVITLTLMVAFTFFTSSASAGGWATIVFDPLPETIQAGDTVTVRFIVRQHGNNPVHTAFGEPLVATVNIRISPDGKTSTIEGTPDKELGYYVADIPFPTQGDYELLVTTNALDTTQVAPNPLRVSVSAAPEPVVDASIQKGNIAAETLVAGATATTPSTFSPMVILAGIGSVLLLGVGTIAVVRTR